MCYIYSEELKFFLECKRLPQKLKTSFGKKKHLHPFFPVVRSNLELDPYPQRFESALGKGSDLPHVEVVPIYTGAACNKKYTITTYILRNIKGFTTKNKYLDNNETCRRLVTLYFSSFF